MNNVTSINKAQSNKMIGDFQKQDIKFNIDCLYKAFRFINEIFYSDTLLFLILSFVRINFWYRNAYLFYFICLVALLVVLFFGVTANNSTRWINLYFLNLQPSELMKIAIIVCFARYYHRMQSADIQNYRFLLIPIILLVIPCYLVIMQPDLGTSILIAGSGIVVIWIAGLNIKYFVYSSLLLLVSFPFIVSILKKHI